MFKDESADSGKPNAFTLFLILILLILSKNIINTVKQSKAKQKEKKAGKKQAKKRFSILPAPEERDDDQVKTREESKEE